MIIGAFHFHGLVKGIDISDFIKFTDSDFTNGNKLPYKLINLIKKGDIIYHLPLLDNFIGFNTFSKIRDYTKTCNYILKYITKDCVKNEARHCLHIF